jgi:uncharacterized CHY-type Zn-finger protein
MKFYFCEACGKRLTEHDIEQGAARDKQLKGVFCTECAVGVTIMETLPDGHLNAAPEPLTPPVEYGWSTALV